MMTAEAFLLERPRCSSAILRSRASFTFQRQSGHAESQGFYIFEKEKKKKKRQELFIFFRLESTFLSRHSFLHEDVLAPEAEGPGQGGLLVCQSR